MSPDPAAQPENAASASMGLWDHLEELRRRLIHALIGVVLIMCVTTYFGRDLVLWLCQPLLEAQKQLGLPRNTINLSVGGGFMVWVKVSLIAALALAAPWIIYQLWLFVRPGLYASERRVFTIIGPMSAAMSVLAVLTTYYMLMPVTLSFLLMFSLGYPPVTENSASSSSLQAVTSFFNQINSHFMMDIAPAPAPDPASTLPNVPPLLAIPTLDHDPENPVPGQIWFNRSLAEIRIHAGGMTRVIPSNVPSFMVPQIEINEYLSMTLWLCFWVIVSFQIPVVMTVLSAVGLVHASYLSKHRKIVVFILFAVGIIITPNQDIVSNLVFPMMLWGLFEFGLLMMRLVQPKPLAASPALDDMEEQTPDDHHPS